MLESVHKLTGENIIVVTYKDPFEPNIDINKAQEHIAGMLDMFDGVVYRIDDLSNSPMSWNTFVEGIFLATRDVPGSMTDPRIQGILVGADDMVKMASESMKQEQYGATNTPMFKTLDQALARAREKLES